jgi:hypothetical protein
MILESFAAGKSMVFKPALTCASIANQASTADPTRPKGIPHFQLVRIAITYAPRQNSAKDYTPPV